MAFIRHLMQLGDNDPLWDGQWDLPMSGMASDVRGILSAIISRNTVKASSTEMPKEIFSPASGGRKNPIMMSTDNITQGSTMFIM